MAPNAGTVKMLDTCLMNESMNTMAGWTNKGWKDRGMAGGGWVDERLGRAEARRAQLEDAGFLVRKSSGALPAEALRAEPEPSVRKCSRAACRTRSSWTVKPWTPQGPLESANLEFELSGLYPGEKNKKTFTLKALSCSLNKCINVQRQK